MTGKTVSWTRSTRPATINARFIDRLPYERNGDWKPVCLYTATARQRRCLLPSADCAVVRPYEGTFVIKRPRTMHQTPGPVSGGRGQRSSRCRDQSRASRHRPGLEPLQLPFDCCFVDHRPHLRDLAANNAIKRVLRKADPSPIHIKIKKSSTWCAVEHQPCRDLRGIDHQQIEVETQVGDLCGVTLQHAPIPGEADHLAVVDDVIRDEPVEVRPRSSVQTGQVGPVTDAEIRGGGSGRWFRSHNTNHGRTVRSEHSRAEESTASSSAAAASQMQLLEPVSVLDGLPTRRLDDPTMLIMQPAKRGLPRRVEGAQGQSPLAGCNFRSLRLPVAAPIRWC